VVDLIEVIADPVDETVARLAEGGGVGVELRHWRDYRAACFVRFRFGGAKTMNAERRTQNDE
jgi:hypothetical protein